MVGSCKHGDEPSGSIKAGNFLASWASIKYRGKLVRNRMS
jgi:hypothetical protein